MLSTKTHQHRLGKQQLESRMADSLTYQLAINEQAKQGSGKKKKKITTLGHIEGERNYFCYEQH